MEDGHITVGVDGDLALIAGVELHAEVDIDAEKKSKKIIKDLLNYGIEIYKIDTSGYDDIGSMTKNEFLRRKKEAALCDVNDYLLYEALGEIKWRDYYID